MSFVFLLLLASCAKDIDIFIPDEEQEIPVDNRVQSSLGGIILDNDLNPIEGATILFGGMVAMSDANGVFVIPEAAVHPDRALVRIQADGFFEAFPAVYADESGVYFLQVRLQPRIVSASFQADQFASVDAGDINFQLAANSLEDTDGIPYDGQVAAYTAVFDCTDLDQFRQLPGNGNGLNLEMDEVSLNPLLGFQLSLEGAGMDNLAPRVGEVIIPVLEIPASLVQEAPASIPLWKYDVAKGLWEEVGTAYKNGDQYETEICSLGYFLLAESNPYVEISGICQDNAGRGIRYTLLAVRTDVGNFATSAFTDGSGRYRFRIPQETALDLHLLDDCQNSIYATTLGQFSGNTSLPPIIPDPGSDFETYLTGAIDFCAQPPGEGGYLYLETDSWRRPVVLDESGNFAIHLSSCDTSYFSLVAFSVQDPGAQSLQTTHPFYPEMTLGNVQVCAGFSDAFASFTLDNGNVLTQDLVVSTEGGSSLISSGDEAIFIALPGDQPGTYFLEPGMFGFSEFPANEITDSSIQVIIDTFGDSGEVLTGSINGYFTDLQGAEHLVFGQLLGSVQ